MIIIVAKVTIIITIFIVVVPMVTSVPLCSVAPYFTMPTTHSAVISPRNKSTLNSRQNNRIKAPPPNCYVLRSFPTQFYFVFVMLQYLIKLE